jgi:hypothetical protein
MRTLKNRLINLNNPSSEPIIIPEIPVEFPEEFPPLTEENDDEGDDGDDDSYSPIKGSNYSQSLYNKYR